jgi:hypothetical protein
MITKGIKWLITLAIFTYFLWDLSSRMIMYRSELSLMKDEALKIWPIYILITFLLFLAMVIRAHRWALSMGDKKEFGACYRSIAIAYLVQCPLSKLGEVVRVANQKKYSSLGLGSIMSTIVVDRLLDVLALGGLLILSSWLSQGLLMESFPQFAALMPKLITMLCIGFSVLILSMFLEKRIKAFLNQQSFLPQSISDGLASFLDQFAMGIQHSRKLSMLLYFFSSTVLIWLIYFVTFTLSIMYYPGIELSNQDMVLLFAISTIGAIVPIPGGMAYPFFLEKGLLLLCPNLDPAIALSLSILIFLLNFWFTNLVIGGTTWLYQSFCIKRD